MTYVYRQSNHFFSTELERSQRTRNSLELTSEECSSILNKLQTQLDMCERALAGVDVLPLDELLRDKNLGEQ